MAVPSPLESFFRDAGGVLMTYGPTEPADTMQRSPAVVAACGPIELEYAAIRKHAALLDAPTLAVLELRGGDRLDFLNRMLTQELKGLAPGEARRSFWLNRKGRVDADLVVLHEQDRTLLLCDILAAPRTLQGIAGYIISEDCTITDKTSAMHALTLHGPTASSLLDLATSQPASTFQDLNPLRAANTAIAGSSVTILRDDPAGTPGYVLLCPRDAALDVARQLIALGHDPLRHDEPDRAIALRQADRPSSSIRLQLVGWHAFNIARLEAGTALYNLDFGPESLPNETGVMDSRVSLTKGCYLGQEVVARMHARKAMKQTLVAITFSIERLADHDYPILLDPGSSLALASAPDAPIGVITSAAPAPSRSMAPIAFAQVRTPHHQPGSIVIATAEGRPLQGVIQPALAFSPAVRALQP